MPTIQQIVYTACIALLLVVPARADENAEREAFFENKIRPLLASRCMECHGEKKQQGEVRLDHRKFVLEGGPDGPVVVPEKLDDSRLWQVLKYDELDTQMPPDGKLPAEELELIRQWIEHGAYWPEEDAAKVPHDVIPRKADGSIDFAAAVELHWAYQPVSGTGRGARDEGPGGETEVDRLLRERLEAAGLAFSERASKETLIRRLSFDLLGLPPSIEEVREFVGDDDPQAWERLVDRSLASPLYGQRWGRYWLDVSRYADTKGYVFTENRFYPYSYTYRDYVIESLNNDVPYDQFVLEQLAADQLGLPENDPRLAALGFLTLGPRFLNRLPDIIDDRIDVVTRGLMGMTVACARCHDHKYDPIPTADYYSLYGVFNSCYEPELPPLLGVVDENAPEYAGFNAELAKRQQALEDYKRDTHRDLLNQGISQAADYLPAAARNMGLIAKETEIPWQHKEPRTNVTGHWQRFIEKRVIENDPVFSPWKQFMSVPEAELADRARDILSQFASEMQVPASLKSAFEQSPPKARLDVARTYGELISRSGKEWHDYKQAHPEAQSLEDADAERLRSVLYGPGSFTDLAPGDYSPLFERDNRDKITQLKRQVDEWRVTSPDAPPRAMALYDKERPEEPVIFVRGTPGRRGDRVPRRFPQILDDDPDSKFTQGSGRLELARQIVSPNNPLTARVIVNRVWAYHFGSGLVATPSDFGTRGEPPTHPELLDHLAWNFMHEYGWSLKRLHREILLTQAYQQASLDRPEARQADPENRLLWRQNRKRLDFESMRDSLLHVAGLLDVSLGGRPVDLEKQPFTHRRAVYGLIDRNNLPGLLRTFDFPSPDSSSPGRPQTTVPQQALFAMNSPFARTVSQALAERVKKQAEHPAEQSQLLIETVFSRPAADHETAGLTAFLERNSLAELAQALLMTNEFLFVD